MFPHETAIMIQRTIEVGGLTTAFLVSYCAHCLKERILSSTDWMLYVVSCLRIVCFFPMPMIWFRHHRELSKARAQPTLDSVRASLLVAMDRSGLHRFTKFQIPFYTWLAMVGVICYFGEETELSSRLWLAFKMTCLNIVVFQNTFQALMMLWLMNATINRGASPETLKKFTQVVQFQEPWDRNGEPECGICLNEYERDDSIRIFRCAHHFHATCVDKWLSHTGDCPYCRASIAEPQAALGNHAKNE